MEKLDTLKAMVDSVRSKEPDKGKRCPFHHRYHLIWITKYRYKVLVGDVRLHVRDIIRQVCSENRVEILKGVLPAIMYICSYRSH